MSAKVWADCRMVVEASEESKKSLNYELRLLKTYQQKTDCYLLQKHTE